MSLSLRKPTSLGSDTLIAFNQVQSQFNRAPGYVAGLNRDGVQTKMRKGDVSITFGREKITIMQGADAGTRHSITVDKTAFQYKGFQTSDSPPTVVDNFPNPGDHGWLYDTTAGWTYWMVNDAGTLRTLSPGTLGILFSDLSGIITFAQHSDLSAEVGIAHSFPQISGTITAAQHGAITNNAVARHANATDSVDGFMVSTDKSKLDNITAAATASHTLNATAYYLNGIAIITTAAPITVGPVSGTAGATYTTAERDILNGAVDLANHLRTQLMAVGGLF